MGSQSSGGEPQASQQVGEWDWQGMQSELRSKLPFPSCAEVPEELKAMRSLFLCCTSGSATGQSMHSRDFVLHLLRSINFESKQCRLETIMSLLTASWGMHFRAVFSVGGSGLQACRDFATSELRKMTEEGISVTFPVHFEVVAVCSAIFELSGFSVAQNWEITEDEAVYYDFVNPSQREVIVEKLLSIKSMIECEADSMQVPEDELWHDIRGMCLGVNPPKPPRDLFTKLDTDLLVLLKRGKTFSREDVEEEEEAAVGMQEADDLVSIAKMVATDGAKEMWKSWKKKRAGLPGVSCDEVNKLAKDLMEQLGKPEVVEEFARVGEWELLCETRLAGLEGDAFATFKALLISSSCEKGRLWDYVFHFLRWIDFPGDGCFLERTSLGSAKFLSASAGAHIRVLFSMKAVEYMVETEFMELIAVAHLTKLAEMKPQVSLDFPVPFYVVDTGYTGGFSFRVFWVSKEMQVLGWRGLFDSEEYYITDSRKRGLIASILLALKRTLAAEHQQLKQQGLQQLSSPRFVTMGEQVEEVEVAKPLHLGADCGGCPCSVMWSDGT